MEERERLAGEARTLEESLGFILAVAGSVLLSLEATALRRAGVCRTLDGDPEAGRALLAEEGRLRLLAGAVLMGALGYFLCLALRSVEESAGDPAAEEAARTNLLASLLVLAAALLRFLDQKRRTAQSG